MEELFRDYWWLIFVAFGMFMAVQSTFSAERRQQRVLDLIKSYTDQGKEPPRELLSMAHKGLDESLDDAAGGGSGKNDRAWTLVIFAALAAGFGVAWYMSQAEEYAFAFLIVTVTMSVMALGSLLILLLGRK